MEWRPFLGPQARVNRGGLGVGQHARLGVVLSEDGGHREFAGLGIVDAAPALDPRSVEGMDKARVFGHEGPEGEPQGIELAGGSAEKQSNFNGIREFPH